MKLIDFIVCDDVRREVGGKHTLVGVYDDLAIQKPPTAQQNLTLLMRLAFFLRFKLEAIEELPNSIMASFMANGKQLAQMEAPITDKGHKEFLQFVVNFTAFTIPKDSAQIEVEIQVRREGRPVETIRPDPIRLRFLEPNTANDL